MTAQRVTAWKGLHCPRGCQGSHSATCKAQRELIYLGQVGALDHLAELAELVGQAVPADNHTYTTHPGATGRTSAFAFYEAALRVVVKAAQSDEFARNTASGTWTKAVAEARRVRAALLAKGCPVPGRHGWWIER